MERDTTPKRREVRFMHSADPSGADERSPFDTEAIAVSSPADVIAAVPYLLGYTPGDDSIVVIAYNGLQDSLVARGDLAAPGDTATTQAAAAELAETISLNGFRKAMLVGYGPGIRVTPMVDALVRDLSDSGIRVVEALRVEDGRYWSYICTNPECCPPEGVSYSGQDSPVVAQAIVQGLTALPDRDAVAASVAQLSEDESQTVRQATIDAWVRLIWANWPDKQAARNAVNAEGLQLVRELASRIDAGQVEVADQEIGTLGVVLVSLRVRDELMVRINPDRLPEYRQFLTRVVRLVYSEHAAAPASLLAYVALLEGNGALAHVALDRARDADPDYTLAGLLRQIAAAGVPPSKIRLTTTPQELADAYAEVEGPAAAQWDSALGGLVTNRPAGTEE